MQPQTPTPEATPDQGERLPTPIAPEQAPQITPEKGPAPQEKQPTPAGDRANQNAGAPPIPVPAPMAPVDDTTLSKNTQQTIDDTPAIAGDNDLIEKQWVKKAKDVVERTKDDPHEQNKDLNIVKAGYIKKRYNKDVKIPEDKAS